MKKNVIVSIRGLQQAEGFDDENITLVTEGIFYKKDGRYFVRYDESELTGLPGAKTTLGIGRDQVSVMRSGAHPFSLVFERRKPHNSIYGTELGGLTVSVYTHDIVSRMTDRGGSLDVKYAIEVGGAVSAMNHLRVNITEAGGERI
ncbi:MAG: DUF1934 domain-containing protein [Clostridia bacterium]|nr:DUF1934 domain-containing protein [Clostridia bacterium]